MADKKIVVKSIESLPSASANLFANTIPAVDWLGTTTQEKAVAGGGTNLPDNGDAFKRLKTDPEDDGYNSDLVAYTEDEAGQTTAEKMPNLYDSRMFSVAVPLLNTLTMAGGQDEKGFSDVVENITSYGKHKLLTPLDKARTDFAGACIGDTIIYPGGDDGTGATDTIEGYWVNFTKRDLNLRLPVAVKGLFAIKFGDRVITGTGRDRNGASQSFLVAIDENMRMYDNIEPLTVPRYNANAVVVYNPDDPDNTSERFLLIISGKTSHSTFTSTIEAYDYWLKKVNYHDLFTKYPRSRFATVNIKGLGTIGGGITSVDPDTPTASIETYNYNLKNDIEGSLSEARGSLCAANLGDSGIYFAGYTVNGATRTVDKIDLEEGTTPKTAKVLYHWEPTTAKYNWVD